LAKSSPKPTDIFLGEVAGVRKKRTRAYGNNIEQVNINTAKVWEGILQQETGIKRIYIRPHTVCLMLVAMKLIRAASATSPFLEDNYRDGVGYLDMARIIQESDEDDKTNQRDLTVLHSEPCGDGLLRMDHLPVGSEGSASGVGGGKDAKRRRVRRRGKGGVRKGH